MLNIKTTEVIEKEIIKTLEVEDKYFWCSRSVYAVEFSPYEAKYLGENGYKIEFLQVEFEDNHIHHHTLYTGSLRPLRSTHQTSKPWVNDLIYALTHEYYMDSRTKEQFYNDYNNVTFAEVAALGSREVMVAGMCGWFVFSEADAGKTVSVSYTKIRDLKD